MAPADNSVVGVGASAGGLDAFAQLLQGMPADTGMAFVLIQHLDPRQESILAELLAPRTAMNVVQASDRMPLEANRVYVIPPHASISVEAGKLRVGPMDETRRPRMPIDVFFRSLAENCGHRAIGVVLTGTGTDGTLGLKEIKDKDGLVIAQDPNEADYDGMPRSAIASGVVDLVLPLRQIPEALVNYARQRDAISKPALGKRVRDDLDKIINFLRSATAHNFTPYKRSTLQRRIERRMAITHAATSADYLSLLERGPVETNRLARDLLIGVTSFFRDPETYAFLEEHVLRQLVRQRSGDQPLRVWVPGCSTGEEAYSITMLLIEQISITKRNVKIQVFASDLNEQAVEVARRGIYSESIQADLSRARLERFFTPVDHTYKVISEVREAIVFAVHDLLADPPFSNVDLISCRNVLIYLKPEVQEQVLGLFHFALRDDGILVLGSAEAIGTQIDRFKPVGKRFRVYRRIGPRRPLEFDYSSADGDGGRILDEPAEAQRGRLRLAFGELSRQTLLELYAPAAVLVDRNYQGRYYHGSIDRYLRVPAGEASHDVVSMAREGLSATMRSVVHKAISEKESVTALGVRMRRNGDHAIVTISGHPVHLNGETAILVCFQDEPGPERHRAAHERDIASENAIGALERELESTRNELQSTIRDLEVANEELRAANEEALSLNEEFRSTNEELETSKEELQSLNEELNAINRELQEKAEEQRRTAAHLHNLLSSSEIVTLFLDSELHIEFFTTNANTLFNIISSDVGRPLDDLTRKFSDPNLIQDAVAVIAGGGSIKREVRAEDGGWYNREVHPYRTEHDRGQGVVITFADILEIKKAGQRLEATRAYLQSIVDTVRGPLLVLDGDLKVVSASRSFYQHFDTTAAETEGRYVYDLADGQWDIPNLRNLLQQVLAKQTTVENFQLELSRADGGRRIMLLNARRLADPEHERAPMILLAMEDITERRRAQDALEAAKAEAEMANALKSRFLAATSHDLRQPLQTLGLLQGVLARTVTDQATRGVIENLGSTIASMATTIDALLDINQLESGTVTAEVIDFPASSLLTRVQSEYAHVAASKSLELRVVPCSVVIRSDPGLLERLVGNLVSNALKYTRDGKVLVGCRRRRGHLGIEVWDTGVGIPEDQLEAIFEEYHQLHNPARERSRGLGLGLTVVQRVAELLDHRIEVRSTLGRGSMFAIEVPLGRSRRETAEGKAPEATAEGRRLAVLLVEDDFAVRESLGLLLGLQGYEVTAAMTADEALKRVAAGSVRPGVVIADRNLPGDMSGVELVGRLRAQVDREMPALVLTGDASVETMREITESGAVYLRKPVDADKLLKSIKQLVGERPTPHETERAAVAPSAAAVTAEQPGRPVISVVDDDPSIRDAIRMLLEASGNQVETFAACETFLARDRPERSACLLVDVGMPGMDGLELQQRLNAEGVDIPVIVITGRRDVPLAVQAMRAGAVDFLQKPFDDRTLLSAVERALARAAKSGDRAEALRRLKRLTPRESEVLKLIVAGHPNKEVAAQLAISPRTAENHRGRIMEKTAAGSLAELVRLAVAAGVEIKVPRPPD